MANNRYGDKKGRIEVKPVTIETVDRAMRDYFAKKLAISVKTDTDRKKVPVIFSTGERWNLSRDDKQFRDENGTLILPIIAIIRREINKDKTLRGIGQEVKQFSITSEIHKKNSNLQAQVFNRKKRGFPTIKPAETREYLTIPFPDFANVLYEVVIWAQYTQQMNEMLEKIFYSYNIHESFVMPVEYDGDKPKGNSYYFVGHANDVFSADNNFEDFSEQERIIKYSNEITVPAYFILDPDSTSLSYGKDEEGRHILYKKQSSNKTKITEEIVSLDEFEELFD
jgi:hypothetical protein